MRSCPCTTRTSTAADAPFTSAVSLAFPGAIPVITPALSTSITLGLLERQRTESVVRSLAFE